jgi:hypothetical protein
MKPHIEITVKHYDIELIYRRFTEVDATDFVEVVADIMKGLGYQPESILSGMQNYVSGHE